MEKKDLYLKPDDIASLVKENWLEHPTAKSLAKALDAVMVASANYAIKKVAELIEELEEDPAKYYDLLGKVATLGDLKYGLLNLLEES